MGLKPQYPSSDETGQNYGSCRSGKASWYDANARDWIKTPAVRLQIPGNPALRSYAVRSCVEPASGGKRCTRWVRRPPGLSPPGTPVLEHPTDSSTGLGTGRHRSPVGHTVSGARSAAAIATSWARTPVS